MGAAAEQSHGRHRLAFLDHRFGSVVFYLPLKKWFATVTC